MKKKFVVTPIIALRVLHPELWYWTMGHVECSRLEREIRKDSKARWMGFRTLLELAGNTGLTWLLWLRTVNARKVSAWRDKFPDTYTRERFENEKAQARALAELTAKPQLLQNVLVAAGIDAEVLEKALPRIQAAAERLCKSFERSRGGQESSRVLVETAVCLMLQEASELPLGTVAKEVARFLGKSPNQFAQDVRTRAKALAARVSRVR